jgi:hypothetical protein
MQEAAIADSQMTVTSGLPTIRSEPRLLLPKIGLN